MSEIDKAEISRWAVVGALLGLLAAIAGIGIAALLFAGIAQGAVSLQTYPTYGFWEWYWIYFNDMPVYPGAYLNTYVIV